MLRWLASFWTIAPGNGWAFVGLTSGPVLWIIAGYLAEDYALLAQKVAIAHQLPRDYRWLIWKEKPDQGFPPS